MTNAELAAGVLGIPPIELWDGAQEVAASVLHTVEGHAPVELTYHLKERQWELKRRWDYLDERHGCAVTVPEGFRFDLASVPRLLWVRVAPYELSLAAPLIHDFLYRNGGRVMGLGFMRRHYTRREADAVFYDLMESEGVGSFRRRAAYTAVRLFGGGAWQP